MDKRMEELSNLRSYIEDIDKDLTMILQSLQWDRKHILQHSTFVTCKYDSNHRVLLERSEDHERECLLRCNGYNKEDILLPEPRDTESSTLIKLSKEDISQIIDNAAKCDPTFKRVSLKQGVGSEELAPQTLARLQTTYSADERRAIHDAVVSAAPTCHDLTDLALVSFGDNDKALKSKSRTEILAELRDMRRRRTKYRVAAKSTKYSDVLRDVIKVQMEVYGDVLGDTKPDINALNAKIDRSIDSEHNEPADLNNSERIDARRNDSEPNRRENKDKRVWRQDEQKSRDRKYSSRERSRDNKSTRDHRYREQSLDNKLKEGTDRHKDRYRETRYRERSIDRTYERRDSNRQERPDRDIHRHQERRGNRDKHRDSYESNTDLSDLERARNLIVEIKREIEAVERSEEHGRDDCTNTDSIELKNEKRFKDYVSKSESHRRYDREDAHRSRHRKTYRELSSKERHRDERADMRSKRKHDDRRDNVRDERVKHKKYEDDSCKESERGRSADKEVKKICTEDKHKIYYEVYKEINE